MRDVSRLRWLEGKLWGMTLLAVFFILYGMMPWLRAPHLSFRYVWLSRMGTLTTARVERYEGRVHPRANYSYATPDGVRHRGLDERQRRAPGDEFLVYYLPGDPDVSTPHNQWTELEQLAIAVLVGLACATSIVVRIRRRPA